MRILIAPDSFKECLSAAAVAAAVATGWRRARPDTCIVELPMADGGEGTLDAILAATSGERRSCTVGGPLGDPVDAEFGLLGKGVAVVEMAAASGLGLVPQERRDPRISTSRGTGELIRAVLDTGAKEIIVGVGGSATNDGGAGMATALGWRLLDSGGKALPPGGMALSRIHAIDGETVPADVAACRIRVACDVTNPLCGPRGATVVYGPQKGLRADCVQDLDQALRHYAHVLKRCLNVDVADLPRAGAAGGLAAGLHAFLGAELCDGAALVAEVVGLEGHLAQVDLVITGEGRMDGQTLSGKGPLGVARAAGRHAVPVIGIAGMLGVGWEALLQNGFREVDALTHGAAPTPEDLAEAAPRLEAWAEAKARAWA